MDVRQLEGIGVFSGLSRRELEELARLTIEVDVEAGTELTHEGRLAHEFFVIEDGSVEVRRDGDRVAELGAGDFFGEIGLESADARRTATVVATTPVRLIVMATHEFRQMEQHMPVVADRVRAAIRARVDDDSAR